MIFKEIKSLEQFFIITGALTCTFNEALNRFEPNFYLLLYSFMCLTVYEVIMCLHHGDVLYTTQVQETIFKNLLYKCDVLLWVSTICVFMLDNILKHKKTARILNEINKIDENYGLFSSSYLVDSQMKKKINQFFKAFAFYLIISMWLNSVPINSNDLYTAPVHLKVIFVIATALVYMPRMLIELILLLKVQLSFQNITKNLKQINYHEDMYEIIKAFQKYEKIGVMIESNYKYSTITQLLVAFVLLALMLFYQFDVVIKNSVTHNEIFMLSANFLWNWLFIPFFINCSLYGMAKREVRLSILIKFEPWVFIS